jgi:hypothetical protein
MDSVRHQALLKTAYAEGRLVLFRQECRENNGCCQALSPSPSPRSRKRGSSDEAFTEYDAGFDDTEDAEDQFERSNAVHLDLFLSRSGLVEEEVQRQDEEEPEGMARARIGEEGEINVDDTEKDKLF